MCRQNMPIVSIVVPVFNSEKYVARCLDSILAQTLTSIEIICVDDGSTDASLKILHRYEKRDTRIKVIEQKNTGTAFARKRGIEFSIGKYIGFVDSDDWIAADMYEHLVCHAEKHNCDLTLCDYYKTSTGQLQPMKTFTGRKLTVEDFINTSAPPFLCMKLFRNDLKVYMNQCIGKRQAEDVGLLYQVLPHVSQIGYVPEPLYYYFQRSDSSSSGDSFVLNYQIDEYLDAIRQLFQIDYGPYTNLARKHFVQMIYYGLKNSARACFRAEYIEFLQEMAPHFIGCSALKSFGDLTQYLCHETIPPTLVYFELEEKSNCSKICTDSWKNYARHCAVIKLEMDLSSDAPVVVLNAKESGNIKFVEDYLKLQFIYQNGGMAISKRTILNKPLGELRSCSAFWGYSHNRLMNTDFWGAVKHHPLIKYILDSYEEDSIINTPDIGLELRAYFVLCKEYHLPQGDTGEHSLPDGVRVYQCDKLTYKINSNNVAQLYSNSIHAIQEDGFVAAPQDVVEMLIREAQKSAASQDTKALPDIEFYKNELERVKNSRSWRITRPLRKLFNFFRKVKYSQQEVY